jgi:high-affinity iron transporter
MSALAILIALAVLREGSETALFLYGLAAGEGADHMGLFSGGLLGLIGGISVGWVLYAGLARIPLRHFFSITGGLILLLAAGMAGQMARFLAQADLIRPLATPLWDSSALMPMDSLIGKLLHLLAGYEAQPSGIQVLFYGLTFTVILLGMRWSASQRNTSLTPT